MFLKNKPNLISKDGVPIVSLQQESLSLDFLLSGAISFDFQDSQASKAETLIGFNQTTFETLERIYNMSPDNEKIKDAYLDQLNRKKMTLDWEETFAWQELGVLNPAEVPYQNANEYLTLIENKINLIKDNFKNISEIRLLDCQNHPLLIENHTEINSPDNKNNLEIIKKELDIHFDYRKEKLINAAKNKQEILKKIVKVRTYKKIHSVESTNISIVLYNNFNKIVLNFIVDLDYTQEVKINTDYNDKDISDYTDLSRNVYLLKHNIELDMAFQVIEFINDIANNEI